MQVVVYRQGRRARPGIEESVTRYLTLALGRSGRRVSRAVVRLTRVRGDRYGSARRCRVVAELVPRGQIVVEATEQRVSDAIRRAAHRTARRIHERRARRRRVARFVARRRAA